ncbi:hypothetical protein X801_05487 [Opisthorchis viverrini]|uniref:NADP-dependent oxidoreductase domain-containing protein n=1 Tax=Opisthorchis viverrini TaxID=6198 RepID=A0A1S8WW59_OPIVI|nr:hypothetical protein X801_05487 [Opisthorchis viverrini]
MSASVSFRIGALFAIRLHIFTGENLLELPVVQEMCKKYNKTAGQILLRHTVQRGLCAIPKSSNPGRILENIRIIE